MFPRRARSLGVSRLLEEAASTQGLQGQPVVGEFLIPRMFVEESFGSSSHGLPFGRVLIEEHEVVCEGFDVPIFKVEHFTFLEQGPHDLGVDGHDGKAHCDIFGDLEGQRDVYMDIHMGGEGPHGGSAHDHGDFSKIDGWPDIQPILHSQLPGEAFEGGQGLSFSVGQFRMQNQANPWDPILGFGQDSDELVGSMPIGDGS